MRKIILFFQKLYIAPGFLLEAIVKRWHPDLVGDKIRSAYYKNRFFSFGKDSLIREGCCVYHPHLIQLGERSSVGRYTELNPGPGETPCLIIGDDTWIGPYCFFRTASHKFDDPDVLFIKQGHEEKKVILGNDIYTGAKCIFLGGAEVGDHCVIAAGSVVSTKIPSYSVVGGNPARVIRKRKIDSHGHDSKLSQKH